MPRLYTDQPLAAGTTISLPPGAAKHVQVLRLQPGSELTLFNGQGGEWSAAVHSIGRSEVQVHVQAHDAIERELPHRIVLAVGMPANERMDALIEKATELGVAAIQPLVCERSVLRVAGERALRKAAHWHAVAVAACEQCGRNRVPVIAEPLALVEWLRTLNSASARWLLSLADAQPWPPARSGADPVVLLSGPEGGFTDHEEAAAREVGFIACSLGARVLRADTAPLAALAWLALESE
jgi:16S rRNA (uracil1498-N3)-methyltransferase